MGNTQIYADISKRCGGTVYAGVAGPVRTGKSTFIRRFMEVFIIPNMSDEYEKERLRDEMPQSGNGRTITTVEPKFIPAKPVEVVMENGVTAELKMVDCVGFIVPGILGTEEDGHERMVKTPWSSELMSFKEAAEIGTEKVIRDHSVIGILVTSDGSFGDLGREAYSGAEEKAVNLLKDIKKPFVIVLNSADENSEKTRELSEKLSFKYHIPVMPFNCTKMTEKDFSELFNKVLLQFPASEIHFKLPDYISALPKEHWVKSSIIEGVKKWMDNFESMGEIIDNCSLLTDGKVIKNIKSVSASLSEGTVVLEPVIDKDIYYQIISEIMGEDVGCDRELFNMLESYTQAKKGYDSLKYALEQVETGNYGIVAPEIDEMILDKPEVFKQGNKYGVKMTATAPCLHIIKTDITTEISPLIGSESQSEDLADYLKEQYNKEDKSIWDTNLLGKTLREMVVEEMETKVNHVPEGVRGKVQRSLQKISDDGKDYFVCIIF